MDNVQANVTGKKIGNNAEDELRPYTVKEYARLARVNKKTIYEGVANGSVPHFRVNKIVAGPGDAQELRVGEDGF